MVSVTHCGDNADRLSKILEAAQLRFGKYGLGKTTMKEIADDLNLSKGSLYYYFPDKEHLYKAVVEKEHSAFLQALSEQIVQTPSPEQMLKNYQVIRLEYFRKFLNLSRFKYEEFRDLKPIMANSWEEFNNSEVCMIKQIIQNGIDQQLFYCNDPHETAVLLLDLLKGLRFLFIKNKELYFIEESEYNTLKIKTTAFIELFINGLKYNK